jgi:hypothetical protein
MATKEESWLALRATAGLDHSGGLNEMVFNRISSVSMPFQKKGKSRIEPQMWLSLK